MNELFNLLWVLLLAAAVVMFPHRSDAQRFRVSELRRSANLPQPGFESWCIERHAGALAPCLSALTWAVKAGRPAKQLLTDPESGATRPQARSVLHTGARTDVHRPGPTLPILPTQGRGRLRSGASAPRFRSFAFHAWVFAQNPLHPGYAWQELTIAFRPNKGRAVFAPWDGQT